MKKIFFISDTHFGHENVIKFCNRPFPDAHTMNEYMIEQWNSVVQGNDVVYVLGDMFFRCKAPEVEDILTRLKGKKKLILGNHDVFWTKNIGEMKMDKFFESVDSYLETSDGTHGLTLCHYPMVSYRHDSRNYMIHGHIHNNVDADYWPCLKSRERVLNAGVDINGFRPVTFNELIENNIRFKEEN